MSESKASAPSSVSTSSHGPSALRWLPRARLTLLLLALVGLMLLVLASVEIWFLSDRQQADIEAMLAKEQMTLTTNLVNEIQHKIELQETAVQRIAAQFNGPLLNDPARISNMLSTRLGVVGFFSSGLVLVSPEGKPLGEFPEQGRMNRNYTYIPAFSDLVGSGHPVLSEPYPDPTGGTPIMAMLVPCRDPSGKTVAVLIGEVPLTDTHFIGSVLDHRLGQTGGFYLISAASKRILLSTDKSRIFSPLPPPGSNPLLDRIIDGFEGTGVTVSSRGISELLAARSIPSTGWKLVARLPTAEAFAPVETMKQRLAITIGVISVIALALVGLVLNRALRPLTQAANAVQEMVEGKRPLELLPQTGMGEVAGMLRAFNALQGTMATAQKAETTAHNRLRAILENMPIGVAVLSSDRILGEVNPQFRQIFGLQDEDLVGKPARVLYVDEAQYQEIGDRAYPIMLSGGTFRDDVRMARQDGSAVWVRLIGQMACIGDPDAGIIWTAEDITDRHADEVVLHERTEELSRSNRDLELFAYAASHDLRQPLRQVSSYVSLLERGYARQLDEEGRQFISFARSACERMDRLIIDLLEYARIGRSGREHEPVDIPVIITEAIENLTAPIAECNAVVTVNAPASLPQIMGDHSELVRLMQNIIGNAVKYRHPDRQPAIAVQASVKKGLVQLTVADNGIGIAPEYFEKIFGIFQRLHGRGDYEGTGIGLALCKKIVEGLNGRIWVEPGLSSGVVFHVALPAMV